DLPGVLTEQEIDFGIDLLFDTHPTSIPHFPRRRSQEKTRILTSALNKVEKLKRLFDFYGFEWMERTPDGFSTNMVMEFYENYLATLEKKTPPS
ncbi:hypothetical protein HAX54_024784, partial [Datura stramonium]|nr:hypothetical protein [Datura stramonium]